VLEMQQCGYYLLIRGTIGHSGGFRPGAAVTQRGDTLSAAIDLYRAYDIDPRYFETAHWILHIGALGPSAYQVNVSVGGKLVARRVMKLSLGVEGCAA